MGELSRSDVLERAIRDGLAIELAPIVCTDPNCGYAYQYILVPELESWDDAPDYVECGREEREIPGTSCPYEPDRPRTVHDPCPAPAKVYKDEAVLHEDDKTPVEIGNELYENETGH